MWYRDFYPRSRPRREVKGGIKSQSKGGKFGASWWAQRWIAVLESFNLGARLGRGRSYARSGQVLSIDVARGAVKATVQGSRPTPYKIAIKVKTLAEAEWKKVLAVLGSQALFCAKLLAGEMPQDIEQAFTDAKVSLFPEKQKDLETDCSCPDWSNPCKHIAAVYYLLGEEFDRDPFLLFKLRGMNREDLLKGLTRGKTAPRREPGKVAVEEPQALPTDPAGFWMQGALPGDIFGPVALSSLHAALPQRLGTFPFWRGQERFLETMQAIYAQAARKGLAVFLSEKFDESNQASP